MPSSDIVLPVIYGPILAVEYIGLCLNVLGLIGMFYVAVTKIRQFIRTKGQNRTHLLGFFVVAVGFPGELLYVLSLYCSQTRGMVAANLILVVPSSYLYMMFIHFINVSELAIRILYIVTTLVFVGLATPRMFAYSLFDFNDGSVWAAWNVYSGYWYIYVVVLDIIITIWLLKIYITSGRVSKSSNSGRLKAIMIFCCVFITGYDAFAIGVAYLGAAPTVNDEMTYRSVLGLSMMSSSAQIMHASAGMIYLNYLATFKPTVTEVEKPGKPSKAPLRSPGPSNAANTNSN